MRKISYIYFQDLNFEKILLETCLCFNTFQNFFIELLEKVLIRKKIKSVIENLEKVKALLLSTLDFFAKL